MINSRYLLALPQKYEELCEIYPPLVKDVIGNDKYPQYETMLMASQEDIEDEFAKDKDNSELMSLTPFQYLLLNSYVSEEFKQVAIESFRFFLHEDVAILPELEVILIGKLEENIDPRVDLDEPRILTEENFLDFQNKIRESVGAPAVEAPDPDEDPRIKRIKAKGRYRDKLKAKRKGSPKIGTYLTAICCMGIGLNPLNIGEISYASVQWLIEMYQQKEGYSLDIRQLLAGADSKKVKPKYWIRNLN